MRFYEFDRILIDGQEYQDYSQETRKSIGLMLQEPFLYHGTITSAGCTMKNAMRKSVKQLHLWM